MRGTLVFLALVGCSLGFLESVFDREVCYPPLGCFNTQTVRSLSRAIVLLPDEPAKIGTRFFLYTRLTPDISQEEEVSWQDSSLLQKSQFNASRPTKFIIHGFTHDAHQPWVQTMKDELLKNADMNVIGVDWRNGARFPYTQATANIRVVAAELAVLIEQMIKVYPVMQPEDVHIIGHSLGAHCASEVGTRVKRIGRISGLDPAELYFEGGKEVTRLEPRDAEFVDVIHSDGSAFLSSLGLGYRASTGHVDFFPNGGGDQPGCAASAVSKITSSAVNAVTKGGNALTETFACSHTRAVTYFTESINSKCPFVAYPCTSYDDFKAAKCLDCSVDKCSTMGYHADESPSRGNFYLMTNQKGLSPQCSYHYRVTVKAGLMKDQGYGKVNVTLLDKENQSFGPISMTDDDGYLSANTELTRLIVAPSTFGEIESVKVTYEKSSCLTCFLYTDFFQLQSVRLTEGESQKQSVFCGKNQSIAKDQFRVIPKDTLQGC
ncbi:pancreatic lipase-related protein 2-like [Watersipora subatra]|uniref:pancreatic lipase-related protein 2-like n=1 Tax=Watersipora subatra TaxID=2589382 RepID=UPI00355B0B1F